MMKNLILFLVLCNLAYSEQVGIASHYSVRMNGGTHTASGEKLRDDKFVAAHRNIPFNSLVRVTNLKNGKEVLVRIVDRGPAINNRIIDLSQAAAKALGFQKDGITKVKIKVVNPPKAVPVKESWWISLKTRLLFTYEK